MAIVTQIYKRRALRGISEQPIANEVLTRLAEASHLAPSCANNQPWRIITVSDPETLTELKSSLTPGNYWAQKAPAITAFVANLDWDARLDNGRDYAFFDLGMAAMNYQLQAIEEGLVVHPIAGFDATKAKKTLSIPDSAVLMTLVILGYPGDTAHLNERHLALERSERSRKPLDEVFAFDSWDARLEPKAKG